MIMRPAPDQYACKCECECARIVCTFIHSNLGGSSLVALAVAVALAVVATVTVVIVMGLMMSDDSPGFGHLFIIFMFSDIKKESITNGTTNQPTDQPTKGQMDSQTLLWSCDLHLKMLLIVRIRRRFKLSLSMDCRM